MNSLLSFDQNMSQSGLKESSLDYMFVSSCSQRQLPKGGTGWNIQSIELSKGGWRWPCGCITNLLQRGTLPQSPWGFNPLSWVYPQSIQWIVSSTQCERQWLAPTLCFKAYKQLIHLSECICLPQTDWQCSYWANWFFVPSPQVQLIDLVVDQTALFAEKLGLGTV